MLWDAGGREAWAWTRAQAASLAWIGVYLDTIAAWDGWPVLIGVVILVGFAMTLQKVIDLLLFIVDELSDIREMLQNMHYWSDAGQEERARDFEMWDGANRHENHGIPS